MGRRGRGRRRHWRHLAGSARRKPSRNWTGQDGTGSTHRRMYKCRWDALEEEEEEDAGDVMQLGSDQLDWEEVKITIDSGAVDTVGPKEVGKAFPAQPTEAS